MPKSLSVLLSFQIDPDHQAHYPDFGLFIRGRISGSLGGCWPLGLWGTGDDTMYAAKGPELVVLY